MQVLCDYVGRFITLTEEENALFTSLLRVQTIRKKQCIVQPEFVCRHRSFVVQGAMRAYLVDKQGNQHTIAFAIEDWWITDYNSYIFQQPATLFVEALEPTTLVQIEYSNEEFLKETVPAFEKFFRIITERSFAFLQKRLLQNLSMTAAERYAVFEEAYSAIANRVPQYALASYLGMSTEYLSKLRKKRKDKKT